MKKVKLISLITTPILLGGGFAALTLVNQCGNKSEYIDPTDYVGKSDGSEWKGHVSGSGSLNVSLEGGFAGIYSIVSSIEYEATNLIIPKYVMDFDGRIHDLQSISENAFKNSIFLSGTLTIPSTVVSIGNNAFQNCQKINGTLNISSPDSYDQICIWENAFSGCSISKVIFNTKGVQIGAYAFNNNHHLTNFTFIGYDFVSDITVFANSFAVTQSTGTISIKDTQTPSEYFLRHFIETAGLPENWTVN